MARGNIKRMPRIIPWTDEHNMFRDTCRQFYENDVDPNMPQWEKDGQVDPAIFKRAGELGLICPDFPAKYGGAESDWLYNVIVLEEESKVRNSGLYLSLHGNIIAPYLLDYASDHIKDTYMPDIVSGEKILSIAMTEPGTGSDLQAMTTSAVDKGDHYLLNGNKTFISNGHIASLCLVAARTGADGEGISLLLVETDWDGYTKGKKLEKVGLKAQDTTELHFDNIKVPKENLVGKEHTGFRYLMTKLQQERLCVSITSMASAEHALDITVQYVNERKAFGQTIGSFQNTRFKLAEIFTEQEMARAFLDRVIMAHNAGEKRTVQASMCKLAITEMLNRHVSTCLQFFGGYGYMMEYPIAHHYLNSRVQTVYAGSNEIMREIITKDLGI